MPAPRRSDIRFDSRRPATTLVIVIASMVVMKMVMMMMMPKAMMMMMIFLLGRCLLVFIVHLHPFLLLKTRPVGLHLRRSETLREGMLSSTSLVWFRTHNNTRPHCYRHKNHWSSTCRPTIVREVLEQSFATSSSQQDDGLRVNIGETLKRNEY